MQTLALVANQGVPVQAGDPFNTKPGEPTWFHDHYATTILARFAEADKAAGGATWRSDTFVTVVALAERAHARLIDYWEQPEGVGSWTGYWVSNIAYPGNTVHLWTRVKDKPLIGQVRMLMPEGMNFERLRNELRRAGLLEGVQSKLISWENGDLLREKSAQEGLTI